MKKIKIDSVWVMFQGRLVEMYAIYINTSPGILQKSDHCFPFTSFDEAFYEVERFVNDQAQDGVIYELV